jgi:hydrogenase maturation protease
MTQGRILVLALGNDILWDDAVGPLVARALLEDPPDGVDIVESAESGIRLMEILTGYDKALLIDAIQTGEHAPGTVIELHADDFSAVIAPSPHYAGLPECFAVARNLELPMPLELRILAMEVLDPFRIGEGLSEPVEAALPQFVEATREALNAWLAPPS